MNRAVMLAVRSVFVLGAGLLAVGWQTATYGAEDPDPAVEPGQPLFTDAGETSHQYSTRGDVADDPQVPAGDISGGSWPPPGTEATDLPSAGELPGGGPCVEHATVLVPEGGPGTSEQVREAGSYLAWYYRQLASGAGEIPDCPGGGQAVPDVVQIREAVGAELVDRVPRPDPHIDPGWMITGMKAFLETGRPLEFGPETWTVTVGGVSFEVELTGHGSYVVDWGDGRSSGPYEVQGAGWPDGVVTHVWQVKDTYDVTITDTWTVTWSSPFGRESITRELAPVTLADFPVREVEAARVRPKASFEPAQ